MSLLRGNDDVNDLIKRTVNDKSGADSKLMLKLKLRVWDKINTLSSSDESATSKSKFLPDLSSIGSFIDKVNSKERWS